MDEIKSFELKKNLIYYTESNGYIYLYNFNTLKLIKTEGAIKELEQLKMNLIEEKNFFIKKNSIFNFKFFSFTLKNKRNNYNTNKVIDFLFKKYVYFITLFIGLLLLNGVLYNEFKISNFDDNYQKIIYIFIVLTCIVIHEYGHLKVYNSYINIPKMKYGFELRYLVFLLAFISVPFLNIIKEKKRVISAGIYIQVIFGIFINFIFYFFPVQILFDLNVINNTIIIYNAAPVFKLDGYWFAKETINEIKNLKLKNFLNNSFKLIQFLSFVFLILYVISQIDWSVL
jgi:hypothetical protein